MQEFRRFNSNNRRPRGPKEDNGIVLDFLTHGHVGSGDRTALAQVLGEKYLTILEVIPRKDVFLKPGEQVYLGPERRDKIHHVAGRIPYEKLTQTAKMELDRLISEYVKKNEAKFVEFFNKAGPITTRLHCLEILPGIGKKHMWDMISARKEKPFESFKDIKARVKLVPDPEQIITRRIMDELQETDKYKLFVSESSSIV
ncbi:MAG TPA: DUF655 domain-containing protein [Candidatus Woesearchaeota archaeon]|nr:DUF655 domain-containing protein [Candidatus Woesearchaeota archaeon]